MNRQQLHFDIRGYWHPGTGHGAGSALDALTHRDARGLPALPGRTVKGLLRDAMQRAAQLGWLQEARDVHRLFGWRPGSTTTSTATDAAGEQRPGDIPAAGCLRVSDATLPEDVAAYLAAHPDLIGGLYRSHFGTAVDTATGTAREHSLRGMEVVVPLALEASIEVLPNTQPPAAWETLLDVALPLLDRLGAYRNRGMGRVVVTREGVS